MKYLLALILAIATPAMAQHHGHHRGHNFHHRHWHPNHGWVIPTIIGGVVVYEVMKNNQPAPVIVQREPVVVPPTVVCTEWKEIQTSDGKIYRERTCTNQ